MYQRRSLHPPKHKLNKYPNAKSFYREAVGVTRFGLGVNLVLGVVKLVGGIVGSSFALISDAVNSLGDVFVSLVVLVSLRIAQRPPDDEHPYGHTRAEAIAGSSVALLVVVSALLVGWQAIDRINILHDLPPAWTLWIASGNVVIKESLYRYSVHVGKRTNSSVVIAAAWDHRSDALCSLAVLIGLSVVRWGGPDWIGADEIAALVVVAVIMFSGVMLFRRSASELMDVQADEAFVQQIRDAAESCAGVEAVETLRVRKSGMEFFADIHIEVDPQMTVSDGHRIGHRVKKHLLRTFPALRDILVHLEPYPHQHDLSEQHE